LLAALRKNAQHSTGPRSAAGKQNSKFNALKHGECANPENHREVMRALGEDPQEFHSLKQELMTTYGPGDALWEKQIDDLARLYWRRKRLERVQDRLMRRALQEVEERQQCRQQEIAGATFGAPLDPVGKACAAMARRQAALDRSIDRRVRILLAMRKEFLDGEKKVKKRSTNVVENEESSWKTAGESQNVYENKRDIWVIRECC
jgi:hypothetical protein